jgi:hypothetical protein
MQSEDKWVIDIDWLEANDRSFSVMVSNYLCTKCRKKLKIDQNESQPSDILKSIKSCCSRSNEFLSPMLPLQESVFRVLLANGNKGLTSDEINQDLGNRRGIDIYRTTPGLLTRLLENDRHYGFKVVQI